MKRPKIADMNDTELSRFRLMQCRRAARRALQLATTIKEPAALSINLQGEVERTCAWARTVIAITKPAWVAKAHPDQLAAVLAYMCGETH